jgi:hypothetical protein
MHVGSRNSSKSDLAGKSWQLVKFEARDDATLTPDDKSKYTIMFGADGRITVPINFCNPPRLFSSS